MHTCAGVMLTAGSLIATYDHYTHTYIYMHVHACIHTYMHTGVMLTAGFLIATYDHYTHGCWLLANTLANSAAILRMLLRVNKYLLWGGLAVALNMRCLG